ncbi:MAG TPA: NUDIX domain-containing protein [Longimicrobium sp.]
MPISPHVRDLRAQMGSARLLLPSVSALIHDDAGALLLVRQRDGGVWSTPGGSMEFDETPADAVVREAWEETGLRVEPRRVFGVYGGPEFIVRYPNGDESQYVMIVFECAVLGGDLAPDGDETTEVRYWTAGEAAALPLTPWLRTMLPTFYTRPETADFEPARWRPAGAA